MPSSLPLLCLSPPSIRLSFNTNLFLSLPPVPLFPFSLYFSLTERQGSDVRMEVAFTELQSLPVSVRGHFFLRVLLGNDRICKPLASIPLYCHPKVLPPAWHPVDKNIKHSKTQEEKQAGTWEPLGAKILVYWCESSRQMGVPLA